MAHVDVEIITRKQLLLTKDIAKSILALFIKRKRKLTGVYSYLIPRYFVWRKLIFFTEK